MEEFKAQLLSEIGEYCDVEDYKFANFTPLESLFLCGFSEMRQVSILNHGNGLRVIKARYEGQDRQIHEVSLMKGYSGNE